MGLAQMMLRRSLTTTRPSCEQRPVGHALAKDLVFAVVAHGTGAQLVNLIDGTMGAFSGTTKPTWAGPFLSVPGGASTVSWVDWGASKQALTRDLALGPFSILARIYYRGSGSGGFLERSDGNTVNAGWEVGLSATAFGLVFVRASSDLYAFMPALPSNSWINVAICYPGTLVATDVKFYVNGAVQAHSADQTGSGAQGSDFANPMTVGRSSFAQAGVGAGTFNGLIDSIMILRRYLRAEEVRAWTVDPYLSFRQRRGRGLGLDVSPPATGITGSQKAYSQALAGVMRAGSSRANVHGKAVFVSIAGVQYATGRAGAAQVENETLSITENDADTPNTASFAVRGVTPQDGQEVLITLGSVNNRERLFAGTINTDNSGYVGTPANGRDQVSAIDYTWQLTRETITKRWTATDATTIAEEILADAGRGFSSRRVEAGLPVLAEFTVTDQTHLSALNHLAERIGATLKTTSRRSVRFGITPGMGGTDPTPITAASALLTEMTDFAVTRDLSQVITRQPVEGGGANALFDVAPGATTIPIDGSTSWYNAAGGTVVSGPQRITYMGLGSGYTPVPPDVWTEHVAPAQTWQRLIWAPTLDLFVAVGSATTTGVMTSPDGVAWSLRTTPSVGYGGVAWSPTVGLLVAVGNNSVITSPDGITWTSRTPAEANVWAGIVWAPGLSLFVAVAKSGTHRVMTSPDGITWTARTAAAALSWGAVAWAPALNLLVATADSSGANAIMTSPDGITWTQRTAPVGDNWSVEWAPALGLFVVMNGGILTSPDGITWTARTAPSTNTWYGIVWAAEIGLFVAVSINGAGDSTHRVMASPDGITWTAYPTPKAGAWTGIAWAPSVGVFAAVDDLAGDIRAMTTEIPIYEALTGIPPSGAGSILYTIHQGDAVNLRVVVEDLAAQAALAAYIGPHLEDGVLVDDDGIIEGPLIQDGRIAETEARARGQAVIDQRQAIDVAVSLTGHDLNLHAGGILAVDVAAPACVGSFKLTQVTIDTFLPARWPTRKARASSKRFTLEDLLRRAREATR